MPTILLTGASRGIGLELAKAYHADGWDVIGTCRNAANAPVLDIEWHSLEVTDSSSLEKLAGAIGARPLDVIWNNAGVFLDKGVTTDEMTDMMWLETFHINTIAPIRVARRFMENMTESQIRAAVFTSSRLGSISENTGGSLAYRTSKTALNMAVNCLAHEFSEDGYSCVVFHPGWVKTDMGGSDADIDALTSAQGMKSIVDRIQPNMQAEFNGKFFNYNGDTFGW
ncbi:MAG: SDR family oxidoreductase [Alphaproteobacteria bacterium]|nr:SDR family oxidoreductase [Alphaproteobacteria bacterium]